MNKKFFFLLCTFCFTAMLHGQKKIVSDPFARPVSVYINWADYDELSDTVRLTEARAMAQLQQLQRLQKQGMQFDYYMMDAFWFEPGGAYRTWRKKDWPNGYERWLKACIAAGIKPGLWFSVNYIFPAGKYILQANDPAWQSSLSADGKGLCLFDGGYLQHFMESMDRYADKGFRMFKFDFFDMNAVTARLQNKMTADEIRAANFKALRTALAAFRKRHPQVLLIGYNGFGGEMSNTGAPIGQAIEKEWLNVFHTMYCGDPRPADVPVANFWRSKDIYSDHMVRYFQANHFPLKQIDNAGFMIGETGTCYYRGKVAWKGMLLLSLARGGWMNTYYGTLGLLSNEEARWFARAQRLFYPLQKENNTETFGGLPGKSEPYGYLSTFKTGQIVTVVNPSLTPKAIKLPGTASKDMRLLFTDSGYQPVFTTGEITLGPGQIAVIGCGGYAKAMFDMGTSSDVIIRGAVEKATVDFVQDANTLTGSFVPTRNGKILLVFQQFDEKDIPFRSTGGSPPHGKSLGKLLTISVKQGSKEIPITIQYDKAIWSGLSWAVGEINPKDFTKGSPLHMSFQNMEQQTLKLKGQVFYIN